jgi:DNA-binding MarR family transcriptional regulator
VVIESLERIAFSTVAVTTTALQDVAGAELTFLGWRVLVVLGESSTPMRVGDLGTRIGLSRPSVSKLVSRLARRGLITLAADEGDRRAVLAALSPLGEKLRGEVLRRRREILEDAVAPPMPTRADAALELIARRLERWI